jgi:hypothetical protein
LKLFKKAQKGENLTYPFGYIKKIPELLLINDKGSTVEEMLDLNVLDQALAIRAGKLIQDT